MWQRCKASDWGKMGYIEKNSTQTSIVLNKNLKEQRDNGEMGEMC